ncbi:MAG: GTPase [Candidatus Shapirobacteria bacterium]|jgi:hypothetical protein
MIKEEILSKIEAVKKEIHDTPYDKSTQHHHGVLKAKLSRLKDSLEERIVMGSGGGKGGRIGYAIKHSGDASVVLVGLPSVGKSTLLNAVTNAESKVGNYDFTTLGVVPGMMEYRGIRMQILDLPGIIEGAAQGKGFGKKVLSVIRASNLVVLMTDIQRAEWLSKVKQELENAGIRLNKKAPKVYIHKMGKGAIQIIDPFESLDKETMIEVTEELGFENVVVQLGEKLKTIDEFIDALSKTRTYIPLVEVVTKIDTITNYKLRITNLKDENIIAMSASKGIGIEEFKEKVWQGLAMVRVYLKRDRSGEADKKEPLIMKKGQTLDAVLKKVSGGMRDDVNRACIWGKNARFPGQEVSFSYPVFDEMEVWFGR